MRYLTIGLTFAAALCVAAPALADVPLGVGLSLGFPTPIQMFAGGDPPDPNGKQDVTAEYLLTDLTNITITLKANSDCESHTWTVTDPSGTVVDSSGPCTQVMLPVSVDVPPGKPVSGESLVSLHVPAYKEGTTYTIHYKAFGVEGTGDFTVTLLK
jgi:hypothetical protein